MKSSVKTIPNRPIRAKAIDIDKKSRLKAGLTMLMVYYNSIYVGKTNVKVMRSATGGYHVYCDEGFSIEEAMKLGDCRGRIKYWLRQGYTFTFHRKMTKDDITIGIEREANPLSLPFFCVKQVFKRVRSNLIKYKREKEEIK